MVAPENTAPPAGGRPHIFSARLRTAGLLLPALALAGLPLTSGSAAKTALKHVAAASGPAWHGFFAVFLPVAAATTTLLVLHFLFTLQGASCRRPAAKGNTATLAWGMSLAVVALAPWLWPAARELALQALAPMALFHAVYPMAAGCLLAWLWKRKTEKRTAVPEEIIVPAWQRTGKRLVTAIQCRLQKRWPGFTMKIVQQGPWTPKLSCFGAPGAFGMGGILKKWRECSRLITGGRRRRKMEKILGRWSVAGLFYLALTLVFFWIL